MKYKNKWRACFNLKKTKALWQHVIRGWILYQRKNSTGETVKILKKVCRFHGLANWGQLLTYFYDSKFLNTVITILLH